MSSNDNDSHNLNNKKLPGRPAGSKNKPKKCVAEICEELGFNPFEFLVHTAKDDWKNLGYTSGEITKASKDGSTYTESRITLDQRINAASKLAPHVAPTLKAVEVSGSLDVNSTDELEELKNKVRLMNAQKT